MALAVSVAALPTSPPARHQSQSRACRNAEAVWVSPPSRRAAPAFTARRSLCRHRRGSLLVAASSGSAYNPFPFHPEDYYRVGLQMVQTSGPVGLGPQQGYFLLMRITPQDVVEDAERGLIMSVGGDTLAGVAQLAQGLPTGAAGGRPLSLDLLWKVLERGQEISKRTWGVLRVAVVELRGNTFVGRVFFGDQASGAVAWDCDCRPSDACWLALKAKTPIYVHRSVWEESAMMLREIQQDNQDQRDAERGQAGGMFFGEQAAGEALTPTLIMTTPRAADPEPLKRLKMEMRVALKDEDYAAAARIRDHPWMRLHLSSLKAQQEGNEEEAGRCEAQLTDAISKHEREEREGMRNRDADEQRWRGQQQQQQQPGSGGGSSSGGSSGSSGDNPTPRLF